MAKKGNVRVIGDKAKMVGGKEQGRLQSASRGVSSETDDGRVNKAEAIRLAINNHPQAGPTEIVQILAKKGIEVTPRYVSSIKTMHIGGKTIQTRGGGNPKGEKGKQTLHRKKKPAKK